VKKQFDKLREPIHTTIMSKTNETMGAEKKFHAAVKKIAKLIAEVAAGDVSQERPMLRALDNLDNRLNAPEIRGHRETADALYAICCTLRGSMSAARDAGSSARIEARYAEIARLKAEAPILGGYEKEIALMRGRC
jgi:hypothetical protein